MKMLILKIEKKLGEGIWLTFELGREGIAIGTLEEAVGLILDNGILKPQAQVRDGEGESENWGVRYIKVNRYGEWVILYGYKNLI